MRLRREGTGYLEEPLFSPLDLIGGPSKKIVSSGTNLVILNLLSRGGKKAPKLLTSARNFAQGQLEEHFNKHATEWGVGNITKQGYLKRAQDLLSRQPGRDILGHTRSGGDVLRYKCAHKRVRSQCCGWDHTNTFPSSGRHGILAQAGNTVKDNKYACPCCGYLTLSSAPPGTFEVCPVCFWEDDDAQFRDPDYVGGANTISLNEARLNFRTIRAITREDIVNVRPPEPSEIPDGSGRG